MVFRTVSRMQRIPFQNAWFKFPTDVYQPGRRLSLVISEGKIVEVEIIKAFTPFTNSAALLVDAQTSGHTTGLPNRFILKLADRRIYDKWNFETEEDYQSNLRSYINKYGASFKLDNEDRLPWMRFFDVWEATDVSYSREREAYERLREAQASGLVPRFFGTGKIDMITTSPHPSLSHIDGLLLEYIPGRSMASIRPGITITFEEAEIISQRILELGRRLRRFGVCHCDIHVGNIILRATDNSPVLIDWGHAWFGAADLPLHERWNDPSVSTDFHRDIRYLLRTGAYYEGPNDDPVHPTITAGGVWHRFRTPVSNEQQVQRAQKWGNYRRVNSDIASLSAEERTLFYDEDTSIDIEHGLRWKVRKGVKTREVDDPCPVE